MLLHDEDGRADSHGFFDEEFALRDGTSVLQVRHLVYRVGADPVENDELGRMRGKVPAERVDALREVHEAQPFCMQY